MPAVRSFSSVKAAVLIVIALSCTYFCIDWALSAHRAYRNFDEAKVAEPINAVLNLGENHPIEIPFHHTYRSSHAIHLYLMPLNENDKRFTEQCSFQGKLTLLQSDGSVVEDVPLRAYGPELLESVRGLTIGGLSPHPPNGEYTARVEASPRETSISLQQRPVRLVARYYLCGCELIAPAVMIGFSVACGLCAFIFGLWSFFYMRALCSEPEVILLSSSAE